MIGFIVAVVAQLLNRLKDMATALATHDTTIKSILSALGIGLEGRITQHDSEVKALLNSAQDHRTNLNTTEMTELDCIKQELGALRSLLSVWTPIRSCQRGTVSFNLAAEVSKTITLGQVVNVNKAMESITFTSTTISTPSSGVENFSCVLLNGSQLEIRRYNVAIAVTATVNWRVIEWV